MTVEYKNKSLSIKRPYHCPKSNCNGKHFIWHEDGWQCLNCMKIIYRDPPLPYIANNHPQRNGNHSCRSQSYTKKYNSDSDGFPYAEGLNHEDNFDPPDDVDIDIREVIPDIMSYKYANLLNQSGFR